MSRSQEMLITSQNKHLLSWLIAINLFWSLSATIYDWPKIIVTPWYLLPFLPICPIYPLLLATSYLWLKRQRTIPALLATFTFVGSLSYGLLAYLFYPLMMTWLGWDWVFFGNMLWVTFYALQAFLLLPYLRFSSITWLFVASYFFLKDYFDYTQLLFSYFITETTPTYIKLSTLVAALIIHAGLLFWLLLLRLRHD